MDCGGPLPERPVIVIADGESRVYCDRDCAAGALGGLDPMTCCTSHLPEYSQEGPDTR